MDILYILTTYGLLKPKAGGQNRFFNITNQIVNKDNKVTILESKEFMDADDQKFGVIHGYIDKKLTKNLPLPRDFNLDFFKKMFKILNEGKFDVILLSYPSGVLIVKLVLFLLRKNVPIIYDAHNVESDFAEEIFSYKERYSKLQRLIIPIYISNLERISCRHIFDHVIAVSNKDKDIFIDKYNLNDKVSVIPSGCSINPLLSKNEQVKLKNRYGLDSFSKIIIFHGSCLHPANEEAIRLIKDFIAPKFEKENVIFLVGGSGLPIIETPNFKSIGFIENLWEFLSIADIAIVPILKGGGTKLKFMDYLNAGLPIVTTQRGAEGIDVKNGEDALIANSVDHEFVEKIKYLVENEDEVVRIGNNARKLAENKYNWDKIGDELNDLFARIV